MNNRYPPRILLVSWAGLMTLLGLTVFGAYQPLGSFNTGVALTIAIGKALIVATIFMELRERNALMIGFAGAGFFWLAIMLWLALADFVTRPDFPPFAAGDAADATAGTGPSHECLLGDDQPMQYVVTPAMSVLVSCSCNRLSLVTESETEFCILYSILSAVDSGYRAILASDAYAAQPT